MVCRKGLHSQLPSSQAEVREASGQEMRFRVFIFGKRNGPGDSENADVQSRRWRRSSHPWPGLSGTATLGRPRACCGQRDAARGLATSVCYSGVGKRWPEASRGPYQGLAVAAALAGSGRGKPQGWLGWESGSFAFSSPGREALQGRQPAPQAALLHLEQGEKRGCTARGLFLSGFRLVRIDNGCLSEAAQLHKAGSISISSELFFFLVAFVLVP